MTEELVQRVRKAYIDGPRRGAKASGDDYDAGWRAWWARIKENAHYRATQQSARDERGVFQRRSRAKKKKKNAA